jgi:hypothetical protein
MHHLISFRITWLFPLEFNFSFSSSCEQVDFPFFLRFVSFLLVISLYCYNS